MELIATYNSKSGSIELYKEGGKFYMFTVSIFSQSAMPVKGECTLEEAKMMFLTMTQRLTYEQAFG